MSEIGPKPPIPPAMKAERMRTPGRSEAYHLEGQRVSMYFAEAVAGKTPEGGLVYSKNRAIVDPKYSSVEEINSESKYKNMPEDTQENKDPKDKAIIEESDRRVIEARDLFDPNKVDAETLDRRIKLRDAFKTLYDIDAAIESDAQQIIAKKEADLKKKDPDATLTTQEITDIYKTASNEYGKKPDAIDDTSTYAPIMAELERIADPENQSPSADALEARNLVKELNYNKDENVFIVKTREQAFKEGEQMQIERS